ncbi:hypothetical protein J6G99_03235 [bacterium]|nr:hypothetical protein [bacterium]
MLSFIKSSFKKTNECIILATPLVVFFLLAEIYFNFAKYSVNNSTKLIFAIITMLIISSGFMAGWFYMAKKTLELADRVFVFDKDRIKAIWQLVLSIPKGFGELFLSFIGITTISFCLYSFIIYAVTLFVSKFIGTTDILTNGTLLGTTQEIYYNIANLPTNEILVINYWYFLIFIPITIISFFGILWIPEVVYTKKGVIKSLLSSIKKIMLTHKKTLAIYLYVYVLYLFLAILITFSVIHPILYFLAILLFYYFVIHITIVVFSYYEKEFVDE